MPPTWTYAQQVSKFIGAVVEKAHPEIIAGILRDDKAESDISFAKGSFLFSFQI